jgi:hypothetical protein
MRMSMIVLCACLFAGPAALDSPWPDCAVVAVHEMEPVDERLLDFDLADLYPADPMPLEVPEAELPPVRVVSQTTVARHLPGFRQRV